jgi:uncharacterized protein (TIGR02444 family)
MSSSGAEPTSPLWDFVLRLYFQDGVSAACLDLQERFGVDVPLLLFACWLGARHVPLTPERAAAARLCVADWHGEVVRPLRKIRQRLKSGPHPAPSPATETLRNAIKKVELESERLELACLEAHAAGWASAASAASADAAGNLAAMFAAMTARAIDANASRCLATMARAVSLCGAVA